MEEQKGTILDSTFVCTIFPPYQICHSSLEKATGFPLDTLKVGLPGNSVRGGMNWSPQGCQTWLSVDGQTLFVHPLQ